MNQFLEFDIKPASGASVLRLRAGSNGRHHGKMPEIFPDVLADVALAKNVALEAASGLVPPEKSATLDEEAEIGDKKQNSPPEEKILQPAMPVDMTQYMQVIAAVAQKQTSGGEPAPPAVCPAASLASGVTRTETQTAETQDINTDQAEGDVTGNAPKGLAHLAAPKFLEQKIINSRELADHIGKELQVLPNPPSRLTNLSESKEISQPKAVDAELRVIKVETSFSPAASAPLVAQFAKMIIVSLDGPVPGPVAVIGTPVPDPRPDVVRSIQIQLHPDDLGKIKVAMHLRGDELRLQIEVTNKTVETLLLNDHQALKDLMGQAGYDIKDASISIAVSPAEQSQPQRGVAASDPSQGSMVGQGGRQHPGTSEENQNPFQKARGQHVSASDFENGQEAKLPAHGSRRGNGVFV